MKKMKRAISRILMPCVLMVASIFAIVSLSLAWFRTDPVYVTQIDVDAKGVLYLYLPSQLVMSDQSLVPAVAMPGAVAGGLPMDVMRAYSASDPDPSYISQPAQTAVVHGAVRIINEGAPKEPAEYLPVDEDGYVLFPRLNERGKIVWRNNDKNQGYETVYNVVGWHEESDSGGHTFIVDEYQRGEVPAPLIDYEKSEIVWKQENRGAISQYISSLPIGDPDFVWNYSAYGANCWMYEERVMPGAQEATAHFALRFKSSYDPKVDDYIDPSYFVVERVYFNRVELPLEPNEEPGDLGNQAIAQVYDPGHESDHLAGTFSILGTEDLFVYVHLHFAVPDDLIPLSIRDGCLFIEVGMSVESELEEGE